MFTYLKYGNGNLPDLKIQFDIFFNVIHEPLIKIETFFCKFVLFSLNKLNFYLNGVKFLFLFSILYFVAKVLGEGGVGWWALDPGMNITFQATIIYFIMNQTIDDNI